MDTPKSALVITPHPDDAEIGCGGTIARWIREGTKVDYVLCTNGDKGSSDHTMRPDLLAEIRATEQLNAARLLGVSDVIMLRYSDGELEDTREFRKQLVRAIRQFKPEVVLSTDPVRLNFYWHRDHRICGQVTLDAVFPYSRDHLHMHELLVDEGLKTHKVSTLLLWETEHPNIYIDISETLEIKIKALHCHVSQVGGLQEQDKKASHWLSDNARRLGQKAGYQYAESFRAIQFN